MTEEQIKNIIIEVENLKKEKNYTKALSILENVLKTENDYRFFEEIADIYLYQRKTAKALKAVDFALEINPESATGNYLKGFILLSNNKFEQALKYLQKSDKLMPNNAEVLRNVGWAYNMIGETQKGIFILKRALNLSPGDELIMQDLSVAMMAAGVINK